ncbi:hypothetical protein [Erythrobacter alti]|uniref:hypothetical protein n=1 Tax=Erythrobacter alti TaxID=1896145 RepID=UPI0030F3785C
MARTGARQDAFVRTAWAVLLVWAVYSAARLLIFAFTDFDSPGPDDWTRLLQVRALLDGQSWWDTLQYRMNPPDGFSLHWSRLVDMPLALAISVLGERWGMAIVPLLWLLPALFAMRAIMLRLNFSRGALGIGLVLFVLFPLLPGIFAPLAIDHHTPQAVLGLATAALMLSERRWGAVGAGFFAAAWVVISLEALPFVAVIAALYGLRYLGEERRLLPWFLLALTIFALGLSLATRPYSEMLGPYCDLLRPGHIAAFAMATLMAGIGPFLPFQHITAGRFASLLLIPLASVPFAYVLLGPCAVNPMAELDPVLATWWHGYIPEGLPFWEQPVSVALMLIWTLVPIVAGYWLAARGGAFAEGAGVRWLMLLILTLSAWAYSLLLMRAGVLAQMLSVPFAAVLLALLLPQARAVEAMVPRMAATLGCFVLATPIFLTALAKPLDPLVPTATMARGIAAPVVSEPCDLARLDALDQGLVVTTMDDAPELLGLTRHDVTAASYHRNQGAMADVVAAYTGSPEKARAIIAGYEADYVLACLSASDFALYRTADPDNFANALASDDPPSWLEPVAGFENGALRAFRVR